MTRSAITREEMSANPQAVLDVLEFYTDHQKREMEELGMAPNMLRSSSTATSSSGLSQYTETTSAPRFNAGTGLAGSSKPSISAPIQALPDGRSNIMRQDSTPPSLNGKSSTAIAAARAAELVNGAHAQHTNAIAAGSTRSPLPLAPGALQASRPAPPAPRPLLTAGRPAPSAPSKPPLPEHTPSSADLRMRAKAQGQRETVDVRPPGLDQEPIVPQRKDSLLAREQEQERDRDEQRQPQRPFAPPSKSSPGISVPATQVSTGGASTMGNPPPVKPLQPTKKLPNKEAIQQAAIIAATKPADEPLIDSVAAAAAALEKPKDKEKRISTMTEGQIMDKLRSVVCPEDPKTIYSKIKKIGQGYVALHE